MPFDSPFVAPSLEKRSVAQDQQTPEQQAMIEAQRRQQDALIVLEEAKKSFSEAQKPLSLYQVQAFEAWQNTGFRDPSLFYVYEDGANGYHVHDYFTDDPSALVRLQQLARAVESAQSTYQMTTDLVEAKARAGVRPASMEQVYRYTMPELPKTQTEKPVQTLSQALEDWNRGYGQLQEQTQAHFARIQTLFATPFQMPIPGRAANAELPSLQSAHLDQVIASATRPAEQSAVQTAQFESVPEPGAAFARSDELTQEIQIPTMPVTPQPAQKASWYRRAISSLFR